jgi:signal transduction histidine kinase
MIISKHEIEKLSANIRKIIDGHGVDILDNREGRLSILKNDIYTLANQMSEQRDNLQKERDNLRDTLADISHQLKTPLTSMMIMVDLLEDTLEQDVPAPEKQAEFIANIKMGLTRTEWLVSSLLKMARLDSGTVVFAREGIDAAALIERAIEPLQILLDVKNQRVIIGGEANLVCDKRWTAEALTNIIKNASEYSPDGGEICIASGSNPICAWISVTDSGKGIPDSEIPLLFKRFQGSRSERGYGIGLALALAMMRGQDGDIEVDGGGKIQGIGAAFTLKVFK